ncbi:hypothetical protein RJ639_036429 [Escallonia herrerae]|uniref:Uncharacterized protein n=1 Tax=Escallonia herrerae TaxID=1293975 RepID=A0AA88WR84_9ASTE|nr:hypothetical protein RJ639_036429 [Escallonia herrerae]
MACNVSSTESCPALLYYVPETLKSIEEATSLFRVSSNSINRTADGYAIVGSCSCPADNDYFTWHVDYTVQRGDTWESISSKFGSFVVEKPDKTLIASLNITLDILCGCSSGMEILTYRVKKGDTLFSICSRLNAEVNKTAQLNKLENPYLIYVGDLIFIPEPGGVRSIVLAGVKDPKAKRGPKFHVRVVIGIALASIAVVLALITILSWRYCTKSKEARQPSAYVTGARCFSALSSLTLQSQNSTVMSFSSNKATNFPYHEIRDATSNFSLSRKIGQGSYGTVYLGKLRGTDVAVKQMKDTKSREFLAELNVLCKVHHTNLVQIFFCPLKLKIKLIGHAVGGDSLFLVYEFAQNGALSDHLHKSSVRGFAPLPWTTRVQIALDAAKGLEYIHLHIKPYYVHRDVKTSNILLDSNFRAKLADFGLVKLLEEHSKEIGTAASRIVGTIGYLAPEYVRDGYVTTKSDVYGFGVVLMELLSGQPALSRDASPENSQYVEHRSLVDYVSTHSLSHYHEDSLFQVMCLWLGLRALLGDGMDRIELGARGDELGARGDELVRNSGLIF